MNKLYLYVVTLLMLILPVISILVDVSLVHPSSMALIAKWFIFWAIGMRLFTAGIVQVCNPAVTSEMLGAEKEKTDKSIIRELGFANISFGLVGIISLFVPAWRLAALFSGGLFMGLCGVLHAIRKPKTLNENIAMISDITIFLMLVIFMLYLCFSL